MQDILTTIELTQVATWGYQIFCEVIMTATGPICSSQLDLIIKNT